jgi:hypothetical protein
MAGLISHTPKKGTAGLKMKESYQTKDGRVEDGYVFGSTNCSVHA